MRFQHIKVNDMVELTLHEDEIDSTYVKVQTKLRVTIESIHS